MKAHKADTRRTEGRPKPAKAKETAARRRPAPDQGIRLDERAQEQPADKRRATENR